MTNFDYTAHEGLAESKIRSNLLFSRLPEDRNTKILEVGVGSGDITVLLNQTYTSVECVDSSYDTCKVVAARVKNQEHITKFHVYDIDDIMFYEQRFDRIVLMNMLEHLENPIEILKKLGGLLNDNGVIHVTVPLAGSLHRHLGVTMNLLPTVNDLSESDRAYGHFRVYTPDLLKQHINQSGLRMAYVEPCYMKPLPTANLNIPWEMHLALDDLAHKFPEFAAYAYAEIKK